MRGEHQREREREMKKSMRDCTMEKERRSFMWEGEDRAAFETEEHARLFFFLTKGAKANE